MSFRLTVFAFLLGLVSGPWCLRAAEPGPPGVVVLVAPGLGWEEAQTWKPGGNSDALHRLENEGASFRRFHGNPVGAPGHAELLTGRHFLQNGVSGNETGEQLLHDGEITLAEICREAGYATGFFGWWRHGCNVPQHPVAQGFDQFVGRCRSSWHGSSREWIQRDHGPEQEAADALREVGDAVLSFVEGAGERPFLCWVCAPPGNEGIGFLNRLVEDLETGGAENLLSVLIGDMPEVPSGGRLFGGTGSLSEGGVRIPGFWHWPGIIEPGRVIHEIAHNVDVFATLASLTGAQAPQDRRMDGWNLSPLLVGGPPPRWPDRDLGTLVVVDRDPAAARIAYRTTNWLAVRDAGWRRTPQRTNGEAWELYDLISDPLQKYEVGDTYPFVLARLKSDYMRWYLEVGRFGLQAVPLSVGPPHGEEVRLLPEFAETREDGDRRWVIKASAESSAEVEWVGRGQDWGTTWTVRIGDRKMEGPAGQEVDGTLRLGRVSLPRGICEVVLTADGVNAGGDWELRLRNRP